MKIITIGRSDNCDIVIEDPMISRRHAVLRLHPSGRIEIIDYSQNGTSVNGVKIANDKIIRIKRGDSVTFAGTKPLDWSAVTDPSKPFKITLWCVGVIVAVILLIWAFISVRDAVQAHTIQESSDNEHAPSNTGNPGGEDPVKSPGPSISTESIPGFGSMVPGSISSQGTDSESGGTGPTNQNSASTNQNPASESNDTIPEGNGEAPKEQKDPRRNL